MLSSAVSAINQNFKDNLADVGFFALPAQNADNTRLTIWLPNAVYIPKTTEGAKLEAAKKFVAFFNSPEGCEIQNTVNTVTGPYVSACELPGDVPDLVKDVQTYLDDGKASPASGVPLPDQGPEPGEAHRRGRLRHQVSRRGREALRRGCQEAGSAAGPPWLVISVSG